MGEVIQMHRGLTGLTNDKLASWLRRAERLENSLRAKAPFSADDQARAAANLHNLLERLEGEGLRKGNVLAEAGLERDPTNSTKRLDTITLPPGAGDKRRSRIAKKPKPYFKVATAIGRLRSASHAPYLCAIFEGCSFGAGGAFENDAEEARWLKLADQIRRMASSIARTENVARYWHDVCRTNGTYDFIRDRMDVSAGMLDPLGSESGLAHCVEHPADLAPVPSVLIAERTYVPWQENRITFPDGGHIAVRARVQTEVRLALAPDHATGSIGPLLEFRSRLDIEDRHGRPIEPDNRYCDGTGGSDAVAFVKADGVWREVREFAIRDAPQAEFRHDEFEAVYRAWEPVSAAQLRTLLDQADRPFEAKHLLNGDNRTEQEISPFLVGSPAYVLRLRLLNGELETKLAEECRRLLRMLGEHKEAIADAMALAEAEAEARWSAGGTN